MSKREKPKGKGCSCSKHALDNGKASWWCNYCPFVGVEIYQNDPTEDELIEKYNKEQPGSVIVIKDKL